MPSRQPAPAFDAWQIDLHGHRVIYRIAGQGPPVVLIHGMVNSSRHWEKVALRLAADHTVIAPDLIGHGDSATPRGDYSLGAHAAVIRDLLAAIDVERATIVGHSLGGGVAMQFFYQFPQRTAAHVGRVKDDLAHPVVGDGRRAGPFDALIVGGGGLGEELVRLGCRVEVVVVEGVVDVVDRPAARSWRPSAR